MKAEILFFLYLKLCQVHRKCIINIFNILKTFSETLKKMQWVLYSINEKDYWLYKKYANLHRQ